MLLRGSCKVLKVCLYDQLCAYYTKNRINTHYALQKIILNKNYNKILKYNFNKRILIIYTIIRMYINKNSII